MTAEQDRCTQCAVFDRQEELIDMSAKFTTEGIPVRREALARRREQHAALYHKAERNVPTEDKAGN